MDTFPFLVLVSICSVFTGYDCFTWDDGLLDGQTLRVRAGSDVTFLWAYTLGPQESVTSQEWLFQGRSQELVALSSHGTFVVLPAFSQRVQQTTNGGFRITHVTKGDSGTYTVEINGRNTAGQALSEHKSVVLVVEAEASDCDFNANVCRWSATGDWTWTTHAGPSGKPDTGPLGDRNNDTNQSYLYADGSSTQTAGSKARLVSPIIDTTDKCVEFYYNMHGNTEGSLKLNILSQDRTEYTLWQRSGDQTRDWQQARMTLPQSSLPINLVLEATRGSGSSSDVAVDDFRVLPNACGYDGLGCDFEELDLCTWTQVTSNDNFYWGEQVAGAGGQVGGPSVDHTYQTDQGHYVLVANAGHSQGDKATLASRLLPRHTDYCLAMWVYIPSNTSGSLSVERENSGRVQEHIHTVGYQAPPAGQQPTWYFTNVTIPSFYTDAGIYLQATVVDSSAPPMAVDDITLTRGACA